MAKLIKRDKVQTLGYLLEDKAYLQTEYWDNNKSTYAIAKDLAVTSTRVLNALKKQGIKRKTKSQAQKAALKSGRHPHPTEGTTHSAEVKRKISQSRVENWNNLTEEERQEYSELFSSAAKKQWEDMSLEERSRRRKVALDGIREASKKGSKLENYIITTIRSNGYEIRPRLKTLIPNERLEVDMYLPQLKTVIEIDGPSHFLPIWGEKNLRRNQLADSNKNGLLLGSGFVIIRVKNVHMQLSQYVMRAVGENILELLTKLSKKFPKSSDRLIEIEVTK